MKGAKLQSDPILCTQHIDEYHGWRTTGHRKIEKMSMVNGEVLEKFLSKVFAFYEPVVEVL